MSESKTTEDVMAYLMNLLVERRAKGIATYGRPLETFNGRDATVDLVEELIDASAYALQWKLERACLLAYINELEGQVRALTGKGQ